MSDALERYAKEAGLSMSENNLGEVADNQLDEAFSILDQEMPKVGWPWKSLHDLVGPPLPRDLWFVCARPGNGKTTVMLNAMQHYIKHEMPVLYIGMEMPASQLRLQWAAWACDVPYAAVARKQWDTLPPGTKDRIKEHLGLQSTPAMRDLIVFADAERVSMKSLRGWVKDAVNEKGIQVAMVDHLHRMAWGSNDLTNVMAEGVRGLKSMAKEFEIRMLVAAQLRRRAGGDVLDDYMPPSASEIKSTGATEEEADSILLLHRSLKPGTRNGDLAKVRQGFLPVRDIAEENVMRIRIGKCRLDGDVRDRDVRLRLTQGVLSDMLPKSDSPLGPDWERVYP